MCCCCVVEGEQVEDNDGEDLDVRHEGKVHGLDANEGRALRIAFQTPSGLRHSRDLIFAHEGTHLLNGTRHEGNARATRCSEGMHNHADSHVLNKVVIQAEGKGVGEQSRCSR